MNNRTLLIIFLVLLAIYGLTRIFSGKRERSFKAELIQVDTTQVTSIVITPKAGGGDITLKREEQRWIASQGEKNVKAVPNVVTGILGSLMEIRTRRIAAKGSDKWQEYEVGEGQGTRIKVYDDGELLEDFIVGRFAFNQQTQSATSFIRLAGEDEVYAVDGFLAMSFSQNFDNLRDRTVIRMQREMEVTGFTYEFPDTTYRFLKTPEGWTFDGTQQLDSMTVENYLNVLRNVSGDAFADDFDELQASNLPTRTLTVTGNNFAEPLQVTVYQDTTREQPFVIRSRQNNDTFFASDSTGLFQKLFKPADAFLKTE